MKLKLNKTELHAELTRLKSAIAALKAKNPAAVEDLKRLESLKDFVLSELRK